MELKWRYLDNFKHFIVMLSYDHDIFRNYGQNYFSDSWLRTFTVQKDVVTIWSADKALSGKMYNSYVRVRKPVYGAL